MNLFCIKFKAFLIRKAQTDFFNEFNLSVNIFTKKIFFYFFVHNNVKYIHKESLRLVYTNLDTGSDLQDTPNFCDILDKNKIQEKNEAVKDIIFLLQEQNILIPKINNTLNFLTYEFIIGEPVVEISSDEFKFLKNNSNFNGYTPFYNSMCFNMIRTKETLKLIDFKHFEKIDSKKFFIYLNNEDFNINKLYIEKSTERDDINIILDHLRLDYNVERKDIIWIE